MFLICLSMLILPPLGGSTQKREEGEEGLRLNEEEARGGALL